MAKRTTREQNIEQVAGNIYEHLRYTGTWTIEDARRVDETTGWAFEVRYDWESYSPGWFTRIQGCRLGDDLALAWEMAQRWLAGDFRTIDLTGMVP